MTSRCTGNSIHWNDAQQARAQAIFGAVTRGMEHWKGEIDTVVRADQLPEGTTEDEVMTSVVHFVGGCQVTDLGDAFEVVSPGYWNIIGA